MKPAALGVALVWICCVSLTPAIAAGAHGGGGHGGGGGHASAGGGHASAGGGHAVSGGSAGAAHAGGQTHTATTRAAAVPRNAGAAAGAATARPRTGQPAVGTAVPRTTPRMPNPQVTGFGIPSVSPLYRYGGYNSYPYYGAALGLGGIGFYTNPFWSGYAYPGFSAYPGFAMDPNFAYGSAYGSTALGLYSGYGGYSGYDTSAAYSAYAAPAPSPFDEDGPSGGLRLKIEPRNAKVYVDGYYAGIVDDFDGRFQRLRLTPGAHHIKVENGAGSEPLAFDVIIQAHYTTEYRGTLLP